MEEKKVEPQHPTKSDQSDDDNPAADLTAPETPAEVPEVDRKTGRYSCY